MPKKKTAASKATSAVAKGAMTMVRVLVYVTLALVIGVALGVLVIAKIVWNYVDPEVEGTVVKQEGNMVTVKNDKGEEQTWELELRPGYKYEFDGAFQGKKIMIDEVELD